MEGELLAQFQHQLKLENDGRFFLIFPMIICHVIDETSPLYHLTARDVLEKRYEIVITLTGSSRTTGQMSEEKTSYLPKEIMWGHRFNEIVEFDKQRRIYVADYDKFDETVPVDTPLCSAQQFEEIIATLRENEAKVKRIIPIEEEPTVRAIRSITV